MVSALGSGFESWGPFLKGPEKFLHPESRSKISNLLITELFYSHALNINRGSLHIRSFRLYTSLFLDTDKLKMAFRARKVSGAFEKRAPGRRHCVVFLGKTLYSHSGSLHPGV